MRGPRMQKQMRTRCPGGRGVRILIVLWVALLGAGSASAQYSEQIRFDFSASSSISLLGGTIVTPPDGTLDHATAHLYVEATAPGVYVPGGLFVLDFLNVNGTVSKTIPGFAVIAGSYSSVQVAPLVGTLAAAQDGGDFTDSLLLDSNTVIGCTGTGCSALGMPLSDVGLSMLDVSFLPVTDLGVIGGASITTSIPIEIDGVLGTLDLVGVEVGRAFIPEPGTFVLVASGLAVLARGARRHPRSVRTRVG